MIEVKSLDSLTGEFDAILCDAWGVIHDGVAAKPPANKILSQLRESNIPIIIITNAPRRSKTLRAAFKHMGVSDKSYDEIISSGDLGIETALARGEKNCFYLGPEIDYALLEGAGFNITPSLTEAQFILNTGLRDNKIERGEDYLPLLQQLLQKKLPMICVNPDIAVHIGEERRLCAGALARIYEDLGGQVTWIGKPLPLIYEACMNSLARLGRQNIDKSRILAIGDSLMTDILGAKNFGLKTLFISEGIHRYELAQYAYPNTDGVQMICDMKGVQPDYYMGSLA